MAYRRRTSLPPTSQVKPQQLPFPATKPVAYGLLSGSAVTPGSFKPGKSSPFLVACHPHFYYANFLPFPPRAEALAETLNVPGGRFDGFYGFSSASSFYDEKKANCELQRRWADGEVPRPGANIFQSGMILSSPVRSHPRSKPDKPTSSPSTPYSRPPSTPHRASLATSLHTMIDATSTPCTPPRSKTKSFPNPSSPEHTSSELNLPDIQTMGEALFRTPPRKVTRALAIDNMLPHAPSAVSVVSPSSAMTSVPFSPLDQPISSPPFIVHEIAENGATVKGYLLGEEQYQEYLQLRRGAAAFRTSHSPDSALHPLDADVTGELPAPQSSSSAPAVTALSGAPSRGGSAVYTAGAVMAGAVMTFGALAFSP